MKTEMTANYTKAEERAQEKVAAQMSLCSELARRFVVRAKGTADAETAMPSGVSVLHSPGWRLWYLYADLSVYRCVVNVFSYRSAQFTRLQTWWEANTCLGF